MLSYLLTSIPTSERLNYCINELDKFSIQPEIILAPELEDGKESCFFGHLSILERFIKSDSTEIKNEPKEPVKIGLEVSKKIEIIFSSDYGKFGI